MRGEHSGILHKNRFQDHEDVSTRTGFREYSMWIFVESCRISHEESSTLFIPLSLYPFILFAKRIFVLNLTFIQGSKLTDSSSAMSGTQTTISFPIRKKCSFYGRKEDIAKEDFTNATARYTPSKYTPTVKKIVTLTSSESESDSDIENTTEKHNGIIGDRRADSADSTPRSRRRKCNELYGKEYYFI